MRSKVAHNAMWIIACRVVQAVLQLVINMLTARYLGPSNYGMINYAASLVAFFTPVMQLGLNGILVQEIINNPDREGKTIGTALTMSVVSGFLCVIGLISVASISSGGEVETTVVCALYSISMVMEAVHIMQYWFQAKLMFKDTALAMLTACVIASVYKIFLLVTEKGIYWFAISKTIGIAMIDAILLIMYKRCGGKRLSFSWKTGRSMLQRSKFYILANMMVVVFAQTDRIMLKMMIGDVATGFYSAAAACAGITSFVFSAMIDSMRPSILESKKVHKEQYRKRMIMLYSIVIYLSLLQSVVITIAAPVVMDLLYGSSYAAAAQPLRIIVWYTTFSYLGSVRNVWILAEDKHHLLWRVNMTGAAANVALNMILIPRFGVNGAAAATLATQIFTNVILSFFYRELRPTVSILLESLSLKNVKTNLHLIQKAK